MKTSGSERLLKLAVGIALVTAVVGGSLYFGGMAANRPAADSEGEAPADPKQPAQRPDFEVKTHNAVLGEQGAVAKESESGEGASAPSELGRTRGIPGAVTELATGSKVLPERETDAVRAVMERAQTAMERCLNDAVENKTSARGTFFVHFRVGDEGRPSELSVRLKGLRDETLSACLVQVIERSDFSSTSVGTSVFWPIRLSPDQGVLLD
ncbi:MAG: AgmX/PglI C-terminal domain-containing protein [Myxococcota bacterium]|nr:AgmX/PglI C-terminal domain-containing protein [Myxococcota bacterium]